MVVILAVVVGALFAGGFYLMLRRSIVKLIFGLALISQGANLLLFTLSRLTHRDPVFITPDIPGTTLDLADPILQALILTAVVIGFGVQAFVVVLIKRSYQVAGSDDLDEIH
jgi:multicomponent Na+:H+ antiporter subunit C